MNRRVLPKVFIAALFSLGGILRAETVTQNGDIVFQQSRSSQSKAIQLATSSPYSHMGIVFYRQGKPFVLEAIKKVSWTPLPAWINRGKSHEYVIKRLKVVHEDELAKLFEAAKPFEKRPYDPYFEWSENRIYCSELVWKIYDRALGKQLAPLRALRDFDLTSPAVKAKMKERYGSLIPWDQKVVSPADIFNSSLLETIPQ